MNILWFMCAWPNLYYIYVRTLICNTCIHTYVAYVQAIDHYHSKQTMYGNSVASANVQTNHCQNNPYQQSAPVSTNVSMGNMQRMPSQSRSLRELKKWCHQSSPRKPVRSTYKARGDWLQAREDALKQPHWNAFSRQE